MAQESSTGEFANPYVGEVRIFAGKFAPEGWLFCQGQLLAIEDYPLLFTVLGTAYGGDGQRTFGLPDLTSRLPIGRGQLPGGAAYALGQAVGAETVALATSQLPAHEHPFVGGVRVATGGTGLVAPNNNYFGDKGSTAYSAKRDANTPSTLGSGALVGQSDAAGGSQPHPNVQPVLALHYIIALYGFYPSPG